MNTDVPVYHCAGGYYCTSPKVCCENGCCVVSDLSSDQPPHSFYSWYAWTAVASFVGFLIISLYYLWRRYKQGTLCPRRPRHNSTFTGPENQNKFMFWKGPLHTRSDSRQPIHPVMY